MQRLLILVMLVLAAPSVADAEPRGGKTTLSDAEKQKRGRAHFARGKQLADEKRYVEALVELSTGYELTGRPLFLFNMAECARALNDVVQARELYEKYLAAEGNGPFANAARARLVELAPAPPPPAAEPPPPAPVVIPPPATVAASTEAAAPREPIAPAPERRSESHLGRNVLIVSVGLALVAGSIAIYAVTRGPECGTGCVDLR